VRETFEVEVLTNEVIEVHLASLRAGQDELREDVRELRAGNKSLRETMDQKFGVLNTKVDAIDASLNGKIDGVSTSLNAKIDRVDASLSAKLDALNANLSDKISKLSDAVADMRGLQKAILWVMSGQWVSWGRFSTGFE
jgi:uncharacterized phage infection (PIP) family protein YhgE